MNIERRPEEAAGKISEKKVEKAAFKGVSKKVTVKVPKNKKKAYSKLLAKGGIAAGKVRS